MVIWIVAGLLCTFIIAAVSIGSVTNSLAVRPRRSVYDLEEAINFVAERLPSEVTAQVSFEEVGQVLTFHCDYLENKGIASPNAADTVTTDLVVVPDDEPVAYVLGAVESSGLDISDENVAAILEAETEYYRAIGIFGPAV